MITLILITSLTQLQPTLEEEFNITLPSYSTTTTPEPITFMDDSSGESSGMLPFPKKAKKVKKHKSPKKKGKKGSLIHNSSVEFLESSSSGQSLNKYLMAGGISLVCIGGLAVIYKIRQRRNGYEKITPGSVNNYGTVGDGTW